MTPGQRRTEAQRLAELEDAVLRLREASERGTVVVEGARDLRALAALGIGGLHVPVHQGDPLAAVAERLATAPEPVILLMDWDRTGGRLFAALRDLLQGRRRLDVEARRRIAQASHARSLEEVPQELEALRRAVGPP